MVLENRETCLSNPAYVSIEDSYGGNQEWFRDGHYGEGDLIYYGGCGLVSLTDLLIYLGQNNSAVKVKLPIELMQTPLDKKIYQAFLQKLFYSYLKPLRRPFFKPEKIKNESDFVLGIQGWQFKRGLKRALKGLGSGHNQVKFLSLRKKNKNFSEIIQLQLARNIPVPLLIAPTKEMFPKLLKCLGRVQAVSGYEQLANQKFSYSATKLSSHWVTITGYSCQGVGQKEQLLISSWGAVYQMDLADFLTNQDWLSGIVIIK